MGKTKQFHPIIASSKSELPSNAVTSAYHCNSCEHEFAVSFVPKDNETASVDAAKKAMPFCVHCSSLDVTPMEGASFLPSKESELSSIKCPECAQHNILSTESASHYKGAITCVTCGTDLIYPVPETAMDDDEDDTDLGGDSIDDEDMEGDDYEESDVDNTSETSTAEEAETTEAKAEAAKEAAETEVEANNTSDGHNPQTDNKGDEGLVNDKGKSVQMPLRSMVDTKSPKFVRSNDETIACLEGDIVIATLKANEETSDTFGTNGFLNGLRISLAKVGLDKTLENFGFKDVSINIDPEVIQSKKIEAAVAEATVKSAKELAASMDTVRQCLEIAAAGINKSFFKTKSPLKESLVSELMACGFRNPQKVIDKVFREQSDAHNAVLIEVALDLHKKPVEVRNELADAIGESNYTEMSASSAEPTAPEADKIEARLEEPVVADAENDEKPSVKKILAGVGGKKLFGI